MAVPARPVSGNVVDSVWGQVAHDAVVAQDVQAGTVNVSGTTQNGTAAVVFPRPFASPPIVVGIQAAGAITHFAVVGAITVSGFNAILQHRDGTASTFGPFPFHWIAYGPRA
jgi:hypothetical protein